MWRLKLFFAGISDSCIFLWLINTLKNSNEQEIYLYSNDKDKETVFNIVDNFEIRHRYFSRCKTKILKNFHLKVITQTDNPYSGINLTLFRDIPKEFYFGKNIESEDELVLLSFEEQYGVAVFVKDEEIIEDDITKYETTFYYTMLDKIDQINYQIIDRLPLLIEGKNTALHDSVDLNFSTNQRQLHFMNAGEWLNLYPLETLKNQIVKYRTSIIEYCIKNELIFCYSTEHRYNKKTKKYEEIFNSITPKIGFIKQGFFDEWKSGASFSYEGKSNNGVFDIYKVSDGKKSNEYIAMYVLLS